MAIVPPTLMPVRRLVETARIHPASALPTETHQSLPVPVAEPGADLRVVFLYASSQLVRGQGLFLYPPSYRAVINGVSSKFEELKAVASSEFGLAHDPAQPLGKYGLPDGVDADQFTQLRERLYDEYDVLMPLFATGDTTTNRELARVGDDFRRLFALLSEAPLRAYYRAVGRRFFAWLDAVAP